MSGARVEAKKLSVTLNPCVEMTLKQNCMDTIATGVQQLLVDENGDFPISNIDSRVSYLFHPAEEGEASPHPANHLALSIAMSDRELGVKLAELLNARLLPNANRAQPPAVYCEYAILSNNPRPQQRRHLKQTMRVCVVITHPYIPRFLNEICRAVTLYKHGHYSLVRDFYLRNPEGSRVTLTHDEALRPVLQVIYRRHHMAYDGSQKMQNTLLSMAHQLNGSSVGGLFKILDSSVSTKDELYERLNALIHAYHLGEQGDRLPYFEDRMTSKDERVRLVEHYGHGLLTLVHHGDMFYEISERFKYDAGVKLAYVSPDNLFRCGSAALIGGRGSVEESLVRVSNAVNVTLATVPLDVRDPQLVLNNLYANLQPTGKRLPLSQACGVYYLVGQMIPEYIPKEDVQAYVEFANERLHLAREMVQNVQGYQDVYPAYKMTPEMESPVNFLDASGAVRQAGVVSIVGIDGRHYAEAGVRSQFLFDDTDQQDRHGFNEHHQFDFEKTKRFYETQWKAAFDHVLRPDSEINCFVLNPVGCGVFDPSDGSQFTQASAQGFANALKAVMSALIQKNIQLVLPIYDMKKVYAHYRKALSVVFSQEPAPVVMGGTVDSVQLIIAQKYRALNGKNFAIETKTIPDILAHAMQKERKTRQALMALGYVQLNGAGQLALGPLAPKVVIEAFQNVQAGMSAPRVKERIVEAYKQLGGNKFDIQNKTLEEILAHAMQKERKTRQALMGLNFLQSGRKGDLWVNGAPFELGAASNQVQDEQSEYRIKEGIIEAYKQTCPWFAWARGAVKEAFDIYSANLEAIFSHAKAVDDIVRDVLIRLGYVKLYEAREALMLMPKYLSEASGGNAAKVRLENELRMAYKTERGFFYKTSEQRRAKFDIDQATLEEMLRHAQEKNGRMRSVFIKLGYMGLKHYDEQLVLSNQGRGIAAVVTAFNARNPRVVVPSAG